MRHANGGRVEAQGVVGELLIGDRAAVSMGVTGGFVTSLGETDLNCLRAACPWSQTRGVVRSVGFSYHFTAKSRQSACGYVQADGLVLHHLHVAGGPGDAEDVVVAEGSREGWPADRPSPRWSPGKRQ